MSPNYFHVPLMEGYVINQEFYFLWLNKHLKKKILPRMDDLTVRDKCLSCGITTKQLYRIKLDENINTMVSNSIGKHWPTLKTEHAAILFIISINFGHSTKLKKMPSKTGGKEGIKQPTVWFLDIFMFIQENNITIRCAWHNFRTCVLEMWSIDASHVYPYYIL